MLFASRTAVAWILVGGLAVATLSAHLIVRKTVPADQAVVPTAPARIEVWFNQPPAPRVSRLELTGPDGEVALGELEIDTKARWIATLVEGTMRPGQYEVSWRTAGNDGHVQRGTFSFSIQPAE